MQETRQGSVTLVLGGARSGKSRYAQQLAAESRRVVFVATATISDEEMRAKIERHRADRPRDWTTVEEPLDLPRVLREWETETDLIVVDCLTLYAANLLDEEAENDEAIARRIEALCEMLQRTRCAIVLVSNEVGSSVVPEYASGRRYRDLLGELNQRVAAIADDAILMVAGLPLALKGHLEVMQ
jgi:adenosylcobinamide kinase / adenosylcobinamide-phosphate guanylyltransferase